MYLDDDNMLASPTSVRDMLSAIENENDMILWYAQLGRRTPSAKNFGKPYVVRGDVDASGFMFHSKHIGKTKWGNRRCGDYRTAESLSSSLAMKWVDNVLVQSSPRRNALGGLGMRTDKRLELSETKMTAIVMGYDVGEQAAVCFRI
jgi:hypothetical protein